MDEYLDRIPQAEPPEPEDSALGILLRRPRDPLEVLFVRRSRRSRFMPGHLGFPGGRVDESDGPGRPEAFARCASREVSEEVGIRIEPEAWIDIGERITPQLFPIRFRTRFFIASFPREARLPSKPPSPGEIDQIRFAAPGEVLRAWERGELLVPPPALPVLRVLDRESDASLESLADRLREANRLEQRLPRIEFDCGIWILPVHTRTIPPATHTNVWMPGGDRFVIVDPGSDRPDEIERLLGVIERRREMGESPDSILLTHHHSDHTRGVEQLALALGVPVLAHRQVLDFLDLPSGLPAPQALNEGDELDLEGLRLRVLHTPGHAPGHLAFEVVERKILVAGDLLSGVSTILIHPPEGDMELYLASLRRIRDARYRKLLPAHGPPLPSKAVDELIEHRLQRESLVQGELSEDWKDLDVIAGAAYQDQPDLPGFLIEGQALAHLRHLEKRGLARRHETHPRLWALTSEPVDSAEPDRASEDSD